MPDHCNVEPKKNQDISFNRFDRSNPTCLTKHASKLFRSSVIFFKALDIVI
jgi:hypothetical protein